jgi:hypothetical protein
MRRGFHSPNSHSSSKGGYKGQPIFFNFNHSLNLNERVSKFLKYPSFF